jgi:SAM-dependent methyltransferase
MTLIDSSLEPRVVQSADIPDDAWDEVVNASPDGWTFALSGWRRLILRVEPWAFEDKSFGMASGETLIGVMPLQFQRASGRLAASGWGLTGPIVRDIENRASVTAAMITHVRTVAESLGATRIEMGRSPLTAAAIAHPEDQPFGAFGFQDVSTQTRMIALDGGEDALWRGLAKNARQMVQRAKGLGYSVRRTNWAEMVDAYYRAHVDTYTRTGVSPHPRAYFEGIATEMAPRGHAVLWTGFAPDGQPVAFHNDSRFGQGSLYHTACSVADHAGSGINYWLMWESIIGARRDGCRWYEVGEVFPDAVDGKSRGLTVFKSKFGGELRRSVKATWSYAAAAPDQEEQRLQDAFKRSDLYRPASIVRKVDAGDDYVDRLLAERIALVRQFYRGGVAVDLCCATGDHLLRQAPSFDRAIGVDFSDRYLEVARSAAREQAIDNVTFAQADARALPFADGSVNFLYCFSSLYVIPDAARVFDEVGRVLAAGGRAILDLGNLRSLNAVSLRYYPEWPSPQLLTLEQIAGGLRHAGLRTLAHRRFQILPLWSDRPAHLWPLLHPRWRAVMKRRVFGKMLDEWVSSAPLLRSFAFRHLVVCEKAGAP